MGFYLCNIHGEVGIGLACKHIINDMKSKLIAYPCHDVIFKLSHFDNSDLVEMPAIKVCDYCFQSKNLKNEMIIQDYDIVIEEMGKYIGLTHGCWPCIKSFCQKCNDQHQSN